MKLFPFAIIFAAAFFCSTIRNRIDPPPTPLPTLGSTPRPVPTGSPLAEPTMKKSVETNGNTPMPKTISGGVLNGKAISLPKPVYPTAAKAVRASGAVTVQIMVDETGRVVSATAVSGHPLLRQAAVAAANQAEFAPTRLAGKAVSVSGVLTFNFVP